MGGGIFLPLFFMINLGWISKVSKLFSLICGYLLIGLCILILIEVIGRKLFSFSFQGIDEIGGYLVAISGSFAFGFGVLEKAHTRIDIALTRFPINLRNFLNVTAYLAIFLVSSFLAKYSYLNLSESILLWIKIPFESYKNFGPESLNEEINRELDDVKKRGNV
jgi:TRAP-type C4-dicarboxylate transport system permease small subunit